MKRKRDSSYKASEGHLSCIDPTKGKGSLNHPENAALDHVLGGQGDLQCPPCCIEFADLRVQALAPGSRSPKEQTSPDASH